MIRRYQLIIIMISDVASIYIKQKSEKKGKEKKVMESQCLENC